MATLRKYGDCSSDVKGTGSRACDFTSYGDALGIVLFPKGYKTAVEPITTFGAWYLAAVSGLSAFPLIGARDFTQDTPTNEVNTSSTGVMTTIRDGKPQFSFMYERGSCFHKALYDKKGQGRWDVGFVFDRGLLIATDVNDEYIKGFKGGRFDVETFRFQQGTDPQMSTAVLQLLDAYEFNTQFLFITNEEAGISFSDVMGVVEVALDVEPVSNGDTTVTLSATSVCNSDDEILLLESGDVDWTLGGTQATARTISSVTYDADAKTYELILSGALTTGDTIQPSFGVFEDPQGNLFKGKSKLITASVVSA